jgi:S-adenosylhomocysteine hydrolase
MPIDVINVSDETDDKIAFAKLAAWDISIDALTKEQEVYLASWDL